jgi:formiminotetrahydrofolate cyclodeaminase
MLRSKQTSSGNLEAALGVGLALMTVEHACNKQTYEIIQFDVSEVHCTNEMPMTSFNTQFM